MSKPRPADGKPAIVVPPPRANAWVQGGNSNSNNCNMAWNRVAAMSASSKSPLVGTETFRPQKQPPTSQQPSAPSSTSVATTNKKNKKKDRGFTHNNNNTKSPALKKAKQTTPTAGQPTTAQKRIISSSSSSSNNNNNNNGNSKLSAKAPAWGGGRHQTPATKKMMTTTTTTTATTTTTTATTRREHPGRSAQYQMRSSDFPSLAALIAVPAEHPKPKPIVVLPKNPKTNDGNNNNNNKSTIRNNKKPPTTSKTKKKKKTTSTTTVAAIHGTSAATTSAAVAARNKPPDLSNHPFFQQTTTMAAARDLAGVGTAAAVSAAGAGVGEQQQHELLLFKLMMQRDGKMVIQPKKGRQRLKPRKKKFSALKKKVLEERLRKWRELHPTATTTTTTTTTLPGSSSVVVLSGFAEADELQDEDEYEEIQANLLDMACKIGPVKRILIPRTLLQEAPVMHVEETVVPSFVQFEEPNLAAAAVECWNDLMLGGNKLQARFLVSKTTTTDGVTKPPENMDDFEQWCRNAMQHEGNFSPNGSAVKCGEDSLHALMEVVLENALTEDDLEDEECMVESLADIKTLTSNLGKLESLRVEREPAPCVVLSYKCSEQQAKDIVEKLINTVVGGTALVARLRNHSSQNEGTTALGGTIVLRNVLTEDDIEDEDCLEESLNDLREIANQFGSVARMTADVEAGTVEVEFETKESTKMALGALNGMVIGGTSISASLLNQESSMDTTDMSKDPPAATETEPMVMFSGEKRIPERFAECKRVPKIPNSGKPRNYAVMCDDDTVKPLLSKMLSELMRLQRRAIEDKNAKARRRLVMGLREVARGIRAHKVKLVVMANNLDEYGIIDEKLQEIIDMCVREEVPIFFEFSKRTLGKALGKTIKVAVVGVQNAEGAHQEFKKLVGLAPRLSSGLEDS